MRKKSKYRPKHADPLAGIRRLQSASLRASTDAFSRDQITDLCLLHSAALAALMQGTASAADMSTLGTVHNVALTMAEQGMGADEIDAIKRAGACLVAIDARGEQRGRYIGTGEEISAVRYLVDVHQAQLESADCDVGLVVRALDAVRQRVAQGAVA